MFVYILLQYYNYFIVLVYRFSSGHFEYETRSEFWKVFLPSTPGLPYYDYREKCT